MERQMKNLRSFIRLQFSLHNFTFFLLEIMYSPIMGDNVDGMRIITIILYDYSFNFYTYACSDTSKNDAEKTI